MKENNKARMDKATEKQLKKDLAKLPLSVLNYIAKLEDDLYPETPEATLTAEEMKSNLKQKVFRYVVRDTFNDETYNKEEYERRVEFWTKETLKVFSEVVFKISTQNAEEIFVKNIREHPLSLKSGLSYEKYAEIFTSVAIQSMNEYTSQVSKAKDLQHETFKNEIELEREEKHKLLEAKDGEIAELKKEREELAYELEKKTKSSKDWCDKAMESAGQRQKLQAEIQSLREGLEKISDAITDGLPKEPYSRGFCGGIKSIAESALNKRTGKEKDNNV